jgi:hypothetical protein
MKYKIITITIFVVVGLLLATQHVYYSNNASYKIDRSIRLIKVSEGGTSCFYYSNAGVVGESVQCGSKK